MKVKSHRLKKLKSKLERLKIRDDIECFLKMIPLKNLVESQTGNHVYSGKGNLRVGSSYTPVVIRLRIIENEIVLILTAPKIGVKLFGPFEPKTSAKMVKNAIGKSLN